MSQPASKLKKIHSLDYGVDRPVAATAAVAPQPTTATTATAGSDRQAAESSLPSMASNVVRNRAPNLISSKSICAPDGQRSATSSSGSSTCAGHNSGHGAQTTTTTTNRLMHSVSIVVELAQKGSCGSSPPDTPTCSSYSGSTTGSGGGGSGASVSGGGGGNQSTSQEDADILDSAATATSERNLRRLVTSGQLTTSSSDGPEVGAATGLVSSNWKAKEANQRPKNDDEEEDDDDEDEDEDEDDDDDDDEDDDEEEEDCCLSSNLARRVVLVDEADKIFMRNRAQSAEPQVLHKILSEFSSTRLAAAAAGAGSASTACGGAAAAAAALASSLSQSAASPPSADINTQAANTSAAAAFPEQSIMRLSRRPRHSLAAISTPPAAISHQQVPIGGGLQASSPLSSSPSRAVCNSPLLSGGGSGGSGSGGSSELAERGELAKLSMRRNTVHQHANFASLQVASGSQFHHHHQQPLVMRSSGFQTTTTAAPCFKQQQQQTARGNQTPTGWQTEQLTGDFNNNREKRLHLIDQKKLVESDTTTSSSSRFPLIPINSSNTLRRPPIQHRRQSLQFSLLTSGLGRDTSRSLTEEELRGEREFNEQVRSAARSPDLFAAAAAAAFCGSTTATTTATGSSSLHNHLKRNNSHQARDRDQSPARCQSTGGFRSAASIGRQVGELGACVASDLPINLTPTFVLSARNQPNAPTQTSSSTSSSISPNSTTPFVSNQQQQQRRRRVSFGSIDPIILTSTRLPLEEQASDQQQQTSSPSSDRLNPILQPSGCIKQRQRASICGSLLTGQQQQQQHLGILRRLERIAAPQQQLASDTSASMRTSQQRGTEADKQLESSTSLSIRMAEGQNNHSKAIAEVTAPTSSSEVATSSSRTLIEGGSGSEQVAQTTTTTTTQNVHNICPRRSRLASVGEPTLVQSTVELAGGSQVAGAPPPPPQNAPRLKQSKSISTPVAGPNDDSRVRSIMANAKLRQEEFARLLEEHEQIVNEINRFETKISSTTAATAAAAAATAATAKQQEQSGQL